MNKQKLPEGWKEVELGKICDVRDGTHDSPKYISKGYPLITSKNLKYGYIDFSEINFISKIDYNNINKRSKVDVGDILMPMIGTIGNPIIIREKREFAIKNVALIKFNNKNILNTYVKFLLNSNYFTYLTDKVNRGGTQKFIALKDIRSFLIPLPPLPTQKAIVLILEKAEKSKEWRKKADDLTKDYLKSVFLEMFGDKDEFEQVKLGEVTEIVSGSTPKTSKEEYWNGDINWIAPAELIDGENYYYFETKKKITKEGLKSCSSRLFPKGTVMLSTRAPIGKVAIAGKEMCSNQGFKNLISSEKINPVYLYFWLLLKKQYLNSLGRGATFKEISKTIVSNIKIPLPPITLQNKFASIVKQVEAMKEQQKHSKNQINNLFNALMQKAFKGELI